MKEAGYPIHVRITAVTGFSSEAISDWAKRHLRPGSQVFSDGLYARRYLGGFCFRFNRRFAMAAMTERIANAACCCKPVTEGALRVAEAYG